MENVLQGTRSFAVVIYLLIASVKHFVLLENKKTVLTFLARKGMMKNWSMRQRAPKTATWESTTVAIVITTRLELDITN